MLDGGDDAAKTRLAKSGCKHSLAVSVGTAEQSGQEIVCLLAVRTLDFLSRARLKVSLLKNVRQLRLFERAGPA